MSFSHLSVFCAGTLTLDFVKNQGREVICYYILLFKAFYSKHCQQEGSGRIPVFCAMFRHWQGLGRGWAKLHLSKQTIKEAVKKLLKDH